MKKKEVVENGTKERRPLWKLYCVRFDFVTRLCGSTPGDPEIVDAWINARAPKVRPPNSKSIAEIHEEVFETIATAPTAEEHAEEIEKKTLLVFQRSGAPYTASSRGNELVQGARTIRAHMKDCARILSSQYIGKIEGEKSFATRVLNCAYLDERHYWIPVTRQDGTHPAEPDGTYDKPIHVMGPRGPMNAIKTIEYVLDARMEFTLKILGGNVSKEDLSILFQYGGTHGYAGERSDGEGKYTFTINEVEL